MPAGSTVPSPPLQAFGALDEALKRKILVYLHPLFKNRRPDDSSKKIPEVSLTPSSGTDVLGSPEERRPGEKKREGGGDEAKTVRLTLQNHPVIAV